jgi:hypothetical protein
MSDTLWEFFTVMFGILSVIGATLFVISFNIAIYKRDKRIEKKAINEKDYTVTQTFLTIEDEPLKKLSKKENHKKKKKSKK